MNKILSAVALAIALPAVASAQTAPAPAPKADCCEQMNSKMDCGKDMANMHQGMAGAKAPAADAHQNHQK